MLNTSIPYCFLPKGGLMKWYYWCNECDWEQEMDDHYHNFCPKCGHVNIGRIKWRDKP